MHPRPTWAMAGAPNPSVIRLHTTIELTDRTILTCPPGAPPWPLDGIPGIGGVRSVDLHRYRARLNLLPGADPGSVAAAAGGRLSAAWGPPASLPPEEPPRAFVCGHRGDRLVAESLEMAGDDPIATALFGVPGVAEVILAPGIALVRIGRLFEWSDRAPAIAAVVAPARS